MVVVVVVVVVVAVVAVVGGGGCKNISIIIQTTKQLNVNTLTLNKDPEVNE